MEQAILNHETAADLLTKRFFPVALSKMHEIIDVMIVYIITHLRLHLK